MTFLLMRAALIALCMTSVFSQMAKYIIKNDFWPDQCMILGDQGSAFKATRHRWNASASSACGFSDSRPELYANKQAIWQVEKIAPGKYIIKPDFWPDQCMSLAAHMSSCATRKRFPGPGEMCGLGLAEQVLNNKQAVWRIQLVSHWPRKYIVKPELYPEQCMVLGKDGTSTSAIRHSWGTKSFCGFSDEKSVLLNEKKEAIWQFWLTEGFPILDDELPDTTTPAPAPGTTTPAPTPTTTTAPNDCETRCVDHWHCYTLPTGNIEHSDPLLVQSCIDHCARKCAARLADQANNTDWWSDIEIPDTTTPTPSASDVEISDTTTPAPSA